MTDRTDHTVDEGAENGILAEAGNLETTSIGILGAPTARIDLTFAAGSDDDDFDDIGVVDEVIPSGLYGGLDDVAAINASDDLDADADLDSDAEDVDDDVEIELEDGEVDLNASDVVEAEASGEDLHEVDVYDDDVHVDDVQEDDVQVDDVQVDDLHVDDAQVEDVHVDDVQPGELDTVDAIEVVASAPIPVTPAEPAPTAAPVTDTGLTRTALARAERLRTSERIEHPREPEVALTSRRLGEFETGRETPDLLTADRLLDPHHVVKAEPEGAWQHFVYTASGRRINLGDSRRVRDRKELSRRIAVPVTGGAKFIPVISRKGGVGKTTLTTLLGMALADARDDRVIAVDANPDRGTLAERITRSSGRTVRDLVREVDRIRGYNDVSKIVARDETRLDVLASDTDPHVSEAFSDHDYLDVAALAEHYYSFVLTDTGTGIVHSVMGATLARADEIVIVTGLSVDEARLASETLTWLETNGFGELARRAIVVLNNARPGAPIVRASELESHFKSRVRAVLRMPYDSHIAAGSAITFRDLRPETQIAARQIAAAVVEGLHDTSSAA